MDEVSSLNCLDLPFVTATPLGRLFRLVFKNSLMEGPGARSEEKHEPVSDIDTAVMVVSLKALDPEWPIREAFDPIHGHRSAQRRRTARVRVIQMDDASNGPAGLSRIPVKSAT